MIKPTWRLALVFATILYGAALAGAQEEPRRYKHWAIEPNYEQLLKKRFEADKQLGPLKDLVKQLLANPDKVPFNPDQLKDMKLDDENTKKMVQEWVASNPDVQRSLRDWFKKEAGGKQPEMKKLHKDLETIVEDAAKQAGSMPPAVGSIEPPAPKEVDPLAKIAERVLKQTEKTKLGEWLRDSPAWQRAFEDLHGTISDPQAPRWQLEGWQAKLLDPEGGAWQFGATALEHLRNAPKPDLEFNWNPSAPDSGAMPTPSFGTSVGPSLSNSATWILFLLLCLLVAVRLLRWGTRKAAAAQARADLGSWPVRPEAVSTRADLVRAFDYLALGTLGLAVASWNHHAVARRWREQTPSCDQDAQALALLYEQARYTAGADALTDVERAQARHSLRQLAEAF